MRVFAVSDLHIDYKANFEWLLSISEFEYQHDILILAGDLTDQIDKIRASFPTFGQMLSLRHVCARQS